MNNSRSAENRILKIAHGIVCAAAAAAVCIFMGWLIHRVGMEKTPFDTDEADHANAGLELYTWIIRGDVVGVLGAVSRQAFYPPVHSLFVAVSYLLQGPTVAASRLPTAIIFAAYLAVLFAAARTAARRVLIESGMEGSLAWTAGAAILLVAASSPISIFNAVLCMLEITGIFILAVLLLYAACRADETKRPNLFVFAILGVLLFLTKYSFGIITLPALGLAVFLTPAAVCSRKESFASALRLSGIILILLGVWVCCTDTRAMLHFFLGHNSYAPLMSSENLLFEVRSWLSVYCINTLTAAWAAAFALLGAVSGWKLLSIRIAALNSIVAVIILALSTTNEERHFIIALPGILYLAAAGIARSAGFLRARLPQFATFPTLFVILLMMCVVAPSPARITYVEEQITKQFEGRPDFFELAEFIAARVNPSAPIIVNGVSDDFGIEALRWMTASASKLAYTEVILDSYPYRDDKNRTARLRKRNLDAPYRIQGFPKRPFSEVLKRGYYSAAVQHKKLFEEQRFKKEAEEFSAALANQNKSERVLAGRKVTVYSLK